MPDTKSDDRPDDQHDTTDDPGETVHTAIGRETADADAEDPTIGGSSDGDT